MIDESPPGMQVGSRSSTLLRSQTPLLACLAPCVSSNLLSRGPLPHRIYLATANDTRAKRRLSVHNGSRQASSAAAAAQRPSPEDDNANTEPQPLLKPSRRSPDDVRSRQSSLLDRLRNPSRNQTTLRSKEDRKREIDALLAEGVGSAKDDPGRSVKSSESPADYVERMRAEERAKVRRREFQAAQESNSRQGRIFRGMMMPQPRNISAEYESIDIGIPEATRAAATIKSRPSLGRTVEVMPQQGLDLGRALRSLDINCNVNNVRQDARMQKFYERPGLKRKRLKSERWRRRFKIGFKAVVAKVKAMRRKGW